MVAYRSKSSRAVPVFRTTEQQRRGLPMPRVSGYSHINIQPAPDENSNRRDSKQPEDFIRRDSLQNEIEDSLLHPSKPFSAAEPTARPRTFAEAAMSNSRTHTLEDNPDPALAKHRSVESLGPVKYTLKKKKKTAKWTPFDFGAPDSASEDGSIGENSRLPSPIPVTSTSTSNTTTATSSNVTTTHPRISTSTSNPLPASTSTFPTLQEANLVATTSIYKEHAPIGGGCTPTVADTPHISDETNEAAPHDTFHLTATELLGPGPAVLDQQHTQFDRPWSVFYTQGIENQAHEEMSSTLSANPGKDKNCSSNSYDSVEWNLTLPGVPAQIQSPKLAAALAQPIAYTTVGSIINPKAAPQFTAPNRIQREGSGRRPLIPMIQGRQHDSFYPHRGLSPFNAPSAMHHAHQLDQSPNHFGFSHTPPPNATRLTRSARPLQQITSLTEQEKNILANIQGPTAPQMFSGNQRASSPTPIPFNKLSLTQSGTSQPSLHAEESSVEGDMGRYTSYQGPIQRPTQGLTQGPVQGLEKMQTLQRLSKFDNPMQSLALSRLSEFSVSRAESTGVALDNPTVAVEELLRLKDQSSGVTSSKAEASTHKVGELDRAYQFPLLGVADPPKPQANPLFGAFSPSIRRPSNDPPLYQQGYPAPLTAGPPGHRQYQATVTKALVNYPDNKWGTDQRPSTFNPYGGVIHQASSLWSDACNPEPVQQYSYESVVPSHSGGSCNKFIQDTASVDNVSKYYPRGLPTDMTGIVAPLSHATQKKMGHIPSLPEPQNAEEKAAKKKADLDNWFYGGQRRFAGMTGADHIREYEERQLESLNPFGPIRPRPKETLPPILKKPFTIEESKKMSVADAAAPILDAAFGSLLSYMTPANAPDSAKVLSKFEPSPVWLLDTSENGNKSFYGEDWGAPPKRAGEDLKRQ